jgi:hypothetical protein
MVCPSCRQDVPPIKVGFTWWGGFIGAKLINHVECPACHARFNGTTGQSNNTNIVIYTLFVAGLIGALMYLAFTMK